MPEIQNNRPFGTQFVRGGSSVRRLASGEPQSVVDRDASSILPYQLLEAYRNIAEFGKFGRGGVGRIAGGERRANQSMVSRLSRGIRGSSGRRFGSRSGAVMNSVMNRVYAPANIDLNRRISGYTLENERSKSELGLGGIGQILKWIEDRKRWKAEMEANKPGTLQKVAGGVGMITDLWSMRRPKSET